MLHVILPVNLDYYPKQNYPVDLCNGYLCFPDYTAVYYSISF